jgi:hypothetical protein
VGRVQDIHGRGGGGEHLFNLGDLMARDNFRGDDDRHRGAQWLAAFFFKLGFGKGGIAPPGSGCEEFAETPARRAANNEETPRAQTPMVGRANRGFEYQPQFRVAWARLPECIHRSAG